MGIVWDVRVSRSEAFGFTLLSLCRQTFGSVRAKTMRVVQAVAERFVGETTHRALVALAQTKALTTPA